MNTVRVDGFDEAVELLRDIRALLNRIPAPGVALVPKLDVPMRSEKPARPAQKPATEPTVDSVSLGHRQALASLLNVLDDYILGARHNHAGMEHRAEPVGTECWRSFHPADIRTMVNDAARDLGLLPFPLPADPVEDQR